MSNTIYYIINGYKKTALRLGHFLIITLSLFESMFNFLGAPGLKNF